MQPKEIINLPVFTESGQYLGKIVDIELDDAAEVALRYIVKSSNPIKRIFEKTLIIHRSQVVSIDKEKMIVEDSVRKIRERALQTTPA